MAAFQMRFWLAFMMITWPDSAIVSFASSVPSAVYIGKLFVSDQLLKDFKTFDYFLFLWNHAKGIRGILLHRFFQNIDFVTDTWPLYRIYFLIQMIVFHWSNIDFISTYFFAKNDITPY